MFALRALRVGLGPAVYGALRATQTPTAAIGRLAALRSFSSSAPALLATAAKKTTTAAKKKTTAKKPAAAKKKTTAAAKKKPATKAARKPKRKAAAKKTKKVDGRAAAGRRRARAARAARTPEQLAAARKAARDKKARAELRALPKPPKRVPSPFALYIKQHPAAGHGPEYIRARSAEWTALSPADKAAYAAQAEALRPLYRAEYERWAKALSPLQFRRLNADLRRRGKSRMRPPPLAPEDKPPLQPFMRFSADFRRSADPALSFGDVGKAAGAAWRALSDAEKRPYVQGYEVDRAAFKARKSAQA